MMQQHVYQVAIKHAGELHPQFVETWAGYQDTMVDDTINVAKKVLSASAQAN